MLRANTFEEGGALILPHPIVRLLKNTFEGHPSGDLIEGTASLSHIEKSIQFKKTLKDGITICLNKNIMQW